MNGVSPAMRVLCLLILLTTQVMASININTDAVQKIVVFLYAPTASGESEDAAHPIGTGFLVVVPSKEGTRLWLLLVTARHIVDPMWAYCSGPNPSMMYVRINRAKYDPSHDQTGIGFVPVALIQNGQPKYWVNSDAAVDVAVIPVDPTLYTTNDYEYGAVPMAELASVEEMKALTIGDAIVSSGLIPGRSGERRNYPFFKFGNISSKPEELTWTGCPGMPALRLERVWFIAANLVPGNSGSPIFYVPFGGNGASFGGGRTELIGIQSSSFDGADVAGMAPVDGLFGIIEQHLGANADLYRGDPQRKPK